MAVRAHLPVRVRSMLSGVSGPGARGDLLGALTAWALIVPECVAYAQIAGVPPQNAFYAAPVALVAYVLLGRSRFLIIGATSAAAVLSGATVAGITSDPKRAVGLSAALAVVAGGVLLAAGLARLGFVTNFLAEPALYGFLFGMALTIVVRQAAKIVGVSSGDGQFFPACGRCCGTCPTGRSPRWSSGPRHWRRCSRWSATSPGSPRPSWCWSWRWRCPRRPG